MLIEIEEDDSSELIKIIRLDYLVTNSDYNVDVIVCDDVVKFYVCEAWLIDFLEGVFK